MLRVNDPKSAVEAARSESAAPDELAQLCRSDHIFVREAVAENQHTPIQSIRELFPCQLTTENEVRLALSVLKNPLHGQHFVGLAVKLAESRLADFVPRNFYPMLLLEALGANAASSPTLLKPLLDPGIVPNHVRERLAKVATNALLLAALADDPAERVRGRARKRLAELHPKMGT